MIIPTSNMKVNIGNIVTSTKVIDREYCMIYPGHNFVVVDIDESYRRLTLQDMESELIFSNIYFDSITLRVNMDQAKYKYTYDKEVRENNIFISKNCPHTYDGYDGRDIYTKCGNKELNYYECSPRLECAKYIDNEKVKASKVLVKHLRKNKIDNINKSK